MHAAADHLQGDEPVQPAVPGLVDDAHAAAAQLAEDLVVRGAVFSPRLGGRAKEPGTVFFGPGGPSWEKSRVASDVIDDDSNVACWVSS